MVENLSIDWPGLLKWSTTFSDGTVTSNVMHLSPSKMQFLEKALEENLGLAPEKAVINSIAKLQDPLSTDEDKLGALYVIQENVESFPEISRKFDTLGALEPLLNAIRHENSSILSIIFEVLSFVLPNNFTVQMAFWNLGGLSVLLDDNVDILTNVTRFGALSGLLRHAQPIELDFIKHGGYSVLANAIASSNQKIQVKAVNLFRHFLSQGLLNLEEIVSSSVPESLISMLRNGSQSSDSVQYGESCAYAIKALVDLFLEKHPVLNASPRTEPKWIHQVAAVIKQRLQDIMPEANVYEQEIYILETIQILLTRNCDKKM